MGAAQLVIDTRATLIAVFLLACAIDAGAQTNMQLWGTFIAVKPESERLSYEFEFEPKVLVAKAEGEAGWMSFDFTPSVEYAAGSFFDVIGELATGYTIQTDDVNSFELSPRAGIRFHLTPRDVRRGPLRNLGLRHRIVVRDLARFEQRTLFYTGDVDTDAVARFRNRFEVLWPLNRDRVNEDGVRYLMADWEWFIPLDDPAERFANRQRIRAGFAHRRDATWRFEALYVWTRSRDTTDEGFTTSDNIINLRLRRVF